MNDKPPEEVSRSSKPRNSSGHILFPLGKCSLSNGPSTLSDLWLVSKWLLIEAQLAQPDLRLDRDAPIMLRSLQERCGRPARG
jgi:hypothetical protein